MKKLYAFHSTGFVRKDIHTMRLVTSSTSMDDTESFTTWDADYVHFASQSSPNIKPIAIFNECYDAGIIYDGKIYNFEVLLADLKARGIANLPQNDPELIVALYHEYGVNCVDRLEGTFAFVIYDKKQKKIFAARDKIGQKCLYYVRTNDGLAISSSLHVLTDLLDNQVVINKKVVRDTLVYSYPQSRSETWACGIQRIEPAQYLEFSEGTLQFTRYWKKQYKTTLNVSIDVAAQRVLQLLEESVIKHIPSNQAFAIPLSGGIDSSSIACIAKRSSEEIHTISVGYKGEHDCDERSVAKRLASEKGFIWHEVELTEEDYVEYFEEYMPIMEEPIGDAASIAQWASYKKAKELGIPILLSGNGGDELFYGYPSHNMDAMHIYEQNSFDIIRKRRTTLYKYVLGNFKDFIRLMKRDKVQNPFLVYEECTDIFPTTWDTSFDFKDCEAFETYFNDESIPEAKVYSYLFNVWLVNNCLHLGGVLSAPHGVELRSPYLDINLVEYVSSLPSSVSFASEVSKILLKKALRDIVPSYILDAPKRGFAPASNQIERVISHYTPKFFNTKPTNYNQLVMDAFLAKFK